MEKLTFQEFSLTQREIDILSYLISGLVRYEDIAQTLTDTKVFATPDEITSNMKQLAKRIKLTYLPEYSGRFSKMKTLKILRIFDLLKGIQPKQSDIVATIDPHKLTERQRESVFLCSEGLIAKDIASILCITEKTVKNNLMFAAEKLTYHKRINGSLDEGNYGTLAAIAYINATNPPVIDGEDFVPPLFTMPEEYQKYYYYEYLQPQIVNY